MSIQVIIDGTMAQIVGVPVSGIEDVGTGEAAVSLPLSILLYAVSVHQAEQAQHPDKTVGIRVIEQSWTG